MLWILIEISIEIDYMQMKIAFVNFYVIGTIAVAVEAKLRQNEKMEMKAAFFAIICCIIWR